MVKNKSARPGGIVRDKIFCYMMGHPERSMSPLSERIKFLISSSNAKHDFLIVLNAKHDFLIVSNAKHDFLIVLNANYDFLMTQNLRGRHMTMRNIMTKNFMS